MERELINQKYIQELLDVARDQDQDDLVSHLFGRLAQSRKDFLHQSTEMLDASQEKLGPELHKLKNQFANLGCEAVSQLLEEMYQFAKKNETHQVRSRLPEFEKLSEESLQQLQDQISH